MVLAARIDGFRYVKLTIHSRRAADPRQDSELLKLLVQFYGAFERRLGVMMASLALENKLPLSKSKSS